MVLVQVKTAAYQGNLQNYLVYAPSSEPFVSSVCLYFAISPFGLYGAVYSEQRTMNTVQIVQNLLVNGRQFIVQPNDPVKSAFATFRSMWAAAATSTGCSRFLILFVASAGWHWLLC